MYKLIFLVMGIIAIPQACSDSSDSGLVRPIIIAPGISKSRLSAKVDRGVGCFRAKGDKFFNIWINYALFLPFTVKCLIKVLTLHPNYALNKLELPQGVEFQVPGFGVTYSIENIDPIFRIGKVVYMSALVKRLVKMGYKRGYSVRGAPYDFRFGVDQMDSYFNQLKSLVQETYSTNGKKVVLLCHSMGCLRTVQFLNLQSQDWKVQHVEKLIMLGAPMGGSMEIMIPLLVGMNNGLFIYKESKFKSLVRSWPSFVEMLPKPSAFGSSVLVQTRSKNFTAHDYEELFQWADCQECLFNLRRLPRGDLPFPNVDVISISGVGKDTTRLVKFEGDDVTSKRSEISGDGDGRVNQESSNFCSSWKSQHGNNFSIQCLVFANTDHNEFLTVSDNIATIIRLTTT